LDAVVPNPLAKRICPFSTMPDRQADHILLAHQLIEPRLQPRDVDIAGPGGDHGRHFGRRRAARRRAACHPRGAAAGGRKADQPARPQRPDQQEEKTGSRRHTLQQQAFIPPPDAACRLT
jgi:hypothetical protein